jgi:hypothetical protein
MQNGTSDFRPDNVVADALFYDISPGYLGAAQTVLIAGRDFTWHDDADSPNVAIVNETFARKVFGSVRNAIGEYFMRGPGRRYQVVGVVQDGKYRTLTEEPQAAMFFSIRQETNSSTAWWCARPGCATGGDRDGENPERTGRGIARDSADLAG